RVQPRAEPIHQQDVAGQRPQSMLDTMEGVFLEDSSDGNGHNGEAAVVTAEQLPEEMSHLGITVNLPDSGALRPTLVIGLGGFGRRAIQELRARLVDRFGDLAKLPLVRFLYMDPDLEEVRAAVKGTRELACSAAEVCHVHLQPVGNYRRRILEQLLEWLPREKLYNIPRSLQTEGSRALGRLAFADNHLRITARLRREIQGITHPDALYESVSQTGLALRDNRPRIYVIASAGGRATRPVPELRFAMRRVLNHLPHPASAVNVFLFFAA